MKYLTHRGVKLPLTGLGSWQVGDDASKEQDEIQCFVQAYEKHGIFLFDTAEMYGLGKSEKLISKVIKKLGRENLYIVDKIFPQYATEEHFDEHFEQSLKALGTDYIDLYLLHWRENNDLQFVVNKMEELKSRGKIGNWGVSNFDVDDMEDLLKCKNGDKCFVNQILYNLDARGIEYDLLPFLKEHDVLPMIYSPLNNDNASREKLKSSKLNDICARNGICFEALMLSFVIRNNNLITVFKTSKPEHLEENLKALEFDISPYMGEINGIFPPPEEKQELKTI